MEKYRDIKNCVWITAQISDNPDLRQAATEALRNYMAMEDVVREAQVVDNTVAVNDKRKAEATAQKAMAEAQREKNKREEVEAKNVALLERIEQMESRIAGLEKSSD